MADYIKTEPHPDYSLNVPAATPVCTENGHPNPNNLTIEMSCRLCLDKTTSSKNLFTETIKDNPIFKIIMMHFPLTLNSGDGLSQRICEKCYKQINNFHLFYLDILCCLNIGPNKLLDPLNIKLEENNYQVDRDDSVNNINSSHIMVLSEIAAGGEEDKEGEGEENENDNDDEDFDMSEDETIENPTRRRDFIKVEMAHSILKKNCETQKQVTEIVANQSEMEKKMITLVKTVDNLEKLYELSHNAHVDTARLNNDALSKSLVRLDRQLKSIRKTVNAKAPRQKRSRISEPIAENNDQDAEKPESGQTEALLMAVDVSPQHSVRMDLKVNPEYKIKLPKNGQRNEIKLPKNVQGFQNLFPLKNESELENLEEKLRNSNFSFHMQSFLREVRPIGSHLPVDHVLPALISDEVAVDISGEQLLFIKLLKESWSLPNNDDVALEIKKFVRNARRRVTYAKKANN